MKMFKKAAALLLAVMMIAGLALTASAAGEASIVIKGTSTVSVKGRTFNAYKVLDAVLKDSTDASKGITYMVPEALKTYFENKYTLDATSNTFDQDVVAKIKAESDLFAFAKDVLKNGKPSVTKTVTVDAGAPVDQAVIDGLDLGYYIVEDTGSKQPVSAVVLDTALSPKVEINIKADVPYVSKTMNGDTKNNAAMGAEIPYTVTTTVPDMTGYSKYYFYMTDTLSKGLTFNNDVKVTQTPKTSGTASELDASNYTVAAKTVSGGTEIEIVFKDFYNKFNANVGDTLTITYSATVNKDAVIGDAGNTNEIKLTFPNDPNNVPDSDPGEGENPTPNPDKPDPNTPNLDDVMGVTPTSKTTTYVTGLNISKTDENSNPLSGAEFELTGTKLKNVRVDKGTYKVDPDGTFYKLKDGTYTETASNPETADKYDSTSTKYKLTGESSYIEAGEDVHYTATVGDDGKLSFNGLSAGTYKLVETKAPAGYNKLDKPVEFTITWTESDGFDVSGVTEGFSVSKAGGAMNTIIKNNKGTILPSTGGMGTTIFYVVGTMLIMMSGVILITRKRVNNI